MGGSHDEPLLPSAVERRIARSRVDQHATGALPERALTTERTVESYLRGAVMPRYMERLRDVHAQMRGHLRELAALREQLTPEAFADALARWDFEETNELIRQHNAWYPIERDLPMDPRTGEYVLIAGRPYWRRELDAEWALEQLGPYAPGP
jgi:hypothetical protein